MSCASSAVRSRTSTARSARSTPTRPSSRCWSTSSTGRPRSSCPSTRSRRSEGRQTRDEREAGRIRPFGPQEGVRRRAAEEEEEGISDGHPADQGGAGDPGPTGGHRARSARRQHHGVLQAVQRADPGDGGPGDPGRAHHLRRPDVLVHPQAAARRGADQAGGGHREGLGRAEPGQGRVTHPRTGHRHRPEEDGGPQRQRCRDGGEDHRWDREEHGRGGRGMTTVHGKRYREAITTFDHAEEHTPAEAIGIVKSIPGAKFDETVEASFRLGIDTRKQDQTLRGTVTLPNGSGRTVRVAVFAQGEKAREARDAGADVVGGDELVDEVIKGRIDFDAAIATPDMMASVGKAGRVLGPRGLMPNPKTGTVTNDIEKAVADIKGGKIEYRADRTGNVHMVIGKKSFEERALLENYLAVVDEILKAKPSSAKGRYIRSLVVSTTMGPGIRIDPTKPKGVDGGGATA